MSKNLSWTSALGDAYFNDKAGGTAAIQKLRLQAKNAGNLKTTKEQKVVTEGDRPVSFYEARNAPRSKSYEFGMLILNVNDRGKAMDCCTAAPAKSSSTRTTSLRLNTMEWLPPGWRSLSYGNDSPSRRANRESQNGPAPVLPL